LLRQLHELAKAEADLANHEKRLSVIEQKVLTEFIATTCCLRTSYFLLNSGLYQKLRTLSSDAISQYMQTCC
jgi:hypothetical protein